MVVEQSTSPVHATIEERRSGGSTRSKVVLAFSRSHVKASAYCLALSLWNDFVASRSSFGDAPFALGVGRTLLTLAKPNSCTVACLLLGIFAMESEPWSGIILKLCISAILGSRQDCGRSRMCMHRTTRGARRPTCTTPAENVVILRAGLGRGLMDFARGGKSPDEGSYFALIDLFAPAFAREMKSTAPEHLTGVRTAKTQVNAFPASPVPGKKGAMRTNHTQTYLLFLPCCQYTVIMILRPQVSPVLEM